MNLQQLRYVLEVSKRKLSVSDAAEALYTSQPGVSKQIKLLEEELGIDIFTRRGKRLSAITQPGQQVLAIAERVLREADNLRAVGEEFRNENTGKLTIATTHTQARYALPRVIGEFVRRYPKVQLCLRQGSSQQVLDYVLAGEADFAITTDVLLDNSDDLVMLPCAQWNRSVVAPAGHPILRESPLTLETVSQFPLITYDYTFTRNSQVKEAFLGRGLKPNLVLSAIDSDIIKTYVKMGLGIGIIASMSFDPALDKGLVAMDASHLFESCVTRIGLASNVWLRGYTYAFIELFAPHLTRKIVDASLVGGGTDQGL